MPRCQGVRKEVPVGSPPSHSEGTQQVRPGSLCQWCVFACRYSGLPQVRRAVAQVPLSFVRQFAAFR
eukprot:11178798-Lingulodinium_polyedra.AAC.1